MPVPIPSLPVQRAIAHILGSLDDKIELNRQMNRTLEKMAQAIFKSWFIDFDPVRAKAKGRDTGLPKEISDLFPDSFEDSELGEIPKGWEVKPIGDVLKRYYSQYRNNVEESRTLSTLRDTLLPKLISGELPIPDAEKLLEVIE